MKSAREFQTSADISRRVGGNAVKNNWSVSSRAEKAMARVKNGFAECERRKGAIPILAVKLRLGHMFVDHMYLDHVYLNHMYLNHTFSRITPKQLLPLCFIAQWIMCLTLWTRNMEVFPYVISLATGP